MSNTNETTLVSLFHSDEHANKAMTDLQNAGIPKQSIQSLGGQAASSAPEQSLTVLKSLNLPAQDLQVISDGLKGGGTLIIVRADEALTAQAENIFESHEAYEIDESAVAPKAAAATATGDAVIPVVEEELVVGKRNVERGGVRVFTRVVEMPAEEKVVLREEHATVKRHAVNRPISGAELDSLQDQSIEIRGMAEEAVVAKSARVVEEVRVGKESSERTQQIKDTVRKTKVEVDEIGEDGGKPLQQTPVGAKRS